MRASETILLRPMEAGGRRSSQRPKDFIVLLTVDSRKRCVDDAKINVKAQRRPLAGACSARTVHRLDQAGNHPVCCPAAGPSSSR